MPETTLIKAGREVGKNVATSPVLLRRGKKARSVAWQPPEGLTPAEARAVIDAAESDRDRLLLRCLWATGGRVSEVLALRPCDVRRDSLVLPNRKNPSRPVKTVFLSAVDADLPGALLLMQGELGIGKGDPLFRSPRGGALSRTQAWRIVKAASARAGVMVLALRDSGYGQAGQPAPIHPHLFRHARIRQIVRATKSLPLAQKMAGWSKLQMAYLSVGDAEAKAMMQGVDE